LPASTADWLIAIARTVDEVKTERLQDG
jgi:hypothetical protein